MDGDLDQVLTTVGPRLRALRQQHDLTLADLSSATGISLNTLSRLESGQRRPTLLRQALCPWPPGWNTSCATPIAGPSSPPRWRCRQWRRNERASRVRPDSVVCRPCGYFTSIGSKGASAGGSRRKRPAVFRFLRPAFRRSRITFSRGSSIPMIARERHRLQHRLDPS